ncbi:MAG TPA: serine/threonine-protein kinase [Mycobacterium sp.]|uniref:serine/threonine-protein kinase n=1 Tax=Mycobacterium sp. TaxID=1785 RepID=UPI002C820AB8|nr:serine/threonine-protein kinase [Mycobacterium sp.]HME77559.1 serine/threonine-protein kinase [Mycobacterium sp.]
MTSRRGSSRVGTMFGRYELQSLLGAGGMGEVYKAYDTDKDRTVAVKLLRAEFAADDRFQERFRRESQLAARLQEPHVIPVHDWGEINGVLYIDMRLVEGRSVGAVLQAEGPLDPSRATSIVSQVAGALDAAHAAGLVHRDIKPDNVLLTPNDFAYLVDFGIAHFGGETALTSAGSAIGSFAYMAPERFTGPTGPEADVYSLACLLYECLTGQTPFPPGDAAQMMAAHIMAPAPRPSAKRASLNIAFDDVIARGMQKRPELRFPSAGELAHAAIVAASQQAPTQPAAGFDHRQDTREFSQHWPNPEGTGYTPYRDHIMQPQIPQGRNGFGRGQVVLAVASAAMLAAALMVVLWVLFGHTGERNAGTSQAQSASPTMPLTTAEQTAISEPTSESATITQPSINRLPGTDNLGWIGYPAARCDPGTQPAAMARTAQSVLVVCQIQPGTFYYRGVRLSDGASIELANAVRSSVGFDVTNPTDGTRYQIQPTSLTIAPPDTQASSEPMLEYASS